jgi:hypothetical protein
MFAGRYWMVIVVQSDAGISRESVPITSAVRQSDEVWARAVDGVLSTIRI